MHTDISSAGAWNAAYILDITFLMRSRQQHIKLKEHLTLYIVIYLKPPLIYSTWFIWKEYYKLLFHGVKSSCWYNFIFLSKWDIL